MRILYVDPVVKTTTSQNYKYYDGIFEELVKSHEVFLHRGLVTNVGEFLKEKSFQADVVVFGLGWFNHRYYGTVEGLKIPSVCMLFKPQNDLEYKLSFCKRNNIDVVLSPLPDYERYEKYTEVKTMLFPYGFNEKVFFDRGMYKEYDVGFSGALHEDKHYPKGAFPVRNIRTKIGEILKQKSSQISVFWSSSDAKQARIPDYKAYSEKINSSKIWIATQAAFGDITPRYYEVASSGALLFCQKIPEQYKKIFINGYNCVEFDSDLKDFGHKLQYFLDNEEERLQIVNNAMQFFNNGFKWSDRADNLVSIMESVISEKKQQTTF